MRPLLRPEVVRCQARLDVRSSQRGSGIARRGRACNVSFAIEQGLDLFHLQTLVDGMHTGHDDAVAILQTGGDNGETLAVTADDDGPQLESRIAGTNPPDRRVLALMED